MVKNVPNESGIEGFIKLGLGEGLSAIIPILFLGTVSIGMPLSAYIVGDYMQHLLGGGAHIQIITATRCKS